MFSALRCGEYKMMVSSISDDDRDVVNPGGFTGSERRYPYGRLYNLYLDPKETHSYLIRKLAYIEAFTNGIGRHLGSFARFPPKNQTGIRSR
jgi:arylsulfatase